MRCKVPHPSPNQLVIKKPASKTNPLTSLPSCICASTLERGSSKSQVLLCVRGTQEDSLLVVDAREAVIQAWRQRFYASANRAIQNFWHKVFGVRKIMILWPDNLSFVTSALHLSFTLFIFLLTWLYSPWSHLLPLLPSVNSKGPCSFPYGKGSRRRREMSTPNACLFPLGKSHHLKDTNLIYTSLA